MRLADQLIPNNKQKMKANRSTVYVSMLLVYDVEWKELRWIKEVQLRLALFPFWVHATRLPLPAPLDRTQTSIWGIADHGTTRTSIVLIPHQHGRSSFARVSR